MAKTRPTSKQKKSRSKSSALNSASSSFSTNPLSKKSPTVESLLSEASEHLHILSSPSSALPLAQKALSLQPTSLPALELAAEIYLELGDAQSAFEHFSQAAKLDATGSTSNPEKFLWLAQLSPDGGEESVEFYKTAVSRLREILAASSAEVAEERQVKQKLVSALCAMAEIYMSDLCDAPNAEECCERFVNEALLLAPESVEALATLASLRVPQQRIDDAEAAVRRAWEAVKEGGADSAPFPMRVNVARLLVETGCYEEAVDAIETLQKEDDELPDLWYLGGWTLFLVGERERGKGAKREQWTEGWKAAREWLSGCQKKCEALEWEDEGVREHAKELIGRIRDELGDKIEEEDAEEEEDEEWISESEDEEMVEA